MRALPRVLQDRTAYKGLLALVLCYAVMVQSLAGHHDLYMADTSGLHALCLNDAASAHDNPVSDPVTSHDAKVPCCLIFGTGDLPQVLPIITTFRFAVPPDKVLQHEFLLTHDEGAATRPSQPRAPPRMG